MKNELYGMQRRQQKGGVIKSRTKKGANHYDREGRNRKEQALLAKVDNVQLCKTPSGAKEMLYIIHAPKQVSSIPWKPGVYSGTRNGWAKTPPPKRVPFSGAETRHAHCNAAQKAELYAATPKHGPTRQQRRAAGKAWMNSPARVAERPARA